MKTQTLEPALFKDPQPNRHSRQLVGLGVLLIGAVITLAACQTTRVSGETISALSVREEVVPKVQSTDAATQGVLDYIGVHESIRAHAAADPATQSVLDYIRRHTSVVSKAPALDPATQSVLSYIAVHESIPDHAAAVDPATQSVLDYIRLHTNVTVRTQTIDPAAQSVLDYIRAH